MNVLEPELFDEGVTVLGVVELGVLMRKAQTAYGRARSTELLLFSRQLEREFDKAAAALLGDKKA